MSDTESEVGAFTYFRQFFALERDVLVLSLAMFAFSLGFQMTGRYMPRYMSVLGASSIAIGLFGSFGNLISAVYPYPGGALSDRVGSRSALTLFGLASTVGFLVWLFAESFGFVTLGLSLGGVTLLEPVALPVGIFLGLVFAQAWKSFGLGATFAIVKQSVPPGKLATGFASTETFRRTAFLLGPLLASAVLARYAFGAGFRLILAVAAVVALVATVAQHLLYDASEDTLGKSFAGVSGVLDDLAGLPSPLKPLLVADTLIRFANGMVYVFFVIVVTEFLAASATLPVVGFLNPDALFGVLLSVEMAVALLSMVPVAKLAERVGLKPVVALGFVVYAVFPILLIAVPESGLPIAGFTFTPSALLFVLFAFSGLRFAGLPAHKALIVGPAAQNAGGRVTGTYYLVRNTVVIPSAAVGGALYAGSPQFAFGVASAIGLVGVAVFLLFGEEFEAYA